MRVLALLNSVATFEQRTQRGFSRSVGWDQRPDDDLNTLTRGQHWCVVHLAVDTRFQQEVRESPDIVEEYGEHEVEQRTR